MQIEPPKYDSHVIPAWMGYIQQGLLRLPVFQRSFVWPARHAHSLVETILQNRTIGTLLVLENEHTFPSVPFYGAPNGQPGKAAGPDVRLILDGQQRLTALWHGFGGAAHFYPKEFVQPPVFVYVKAWKDDGQCDNGMLEIATDSQPQTGANAYKQYLAQPRVAYDNSCFPLSILAVDGVPTSQNVNKLSDWCVSVFPDDAKRSRLLETQINSSFGERVRNYPIWYHSLPSDTSMESATKIFILSNNTSVPVSKFDIAVAHYDKGNYQDDISKNKGLRYRILEYVNSTNPDVGKEVILSAADLEDPQKLIPQYGSHLMKLACVMSGKPPSDGNFIEADTVDILTRNLKKLNEALSWAANFIKSQGFPLRKYLPSTIPFRVLPGMYIAAKSKGVSERAPFLTLCRAFYWRSVFTKRYERDANRRLHDDYKDLVKGISRGRFGIDHNIKIFNDALFPAMDEQYLSQMETDSSSMRKAICAIGALHGLDFATQENILSLNNISDWDYHHLYPKQYLLDNGVPKNHVNHCLNFALIRKDTNSRIIGKLPPCEYLSDQTDLAEGAVPPSEVRNAVASHLIPLREIMARPAGGNAGEVYSKFISSRGKLIADEINMLCRGRVRSSSK